MAFLHGSVMSTPFIFNPPTDLPGLVGWYDANDAATLTFSSGVLISQWNDKSGAGNHLKQTTVADQPVWSSTAAPGSRGAVTFPSNDFLLADTYSSALTQPVTYVAVCTLPAGPQLMIDGAVSGARIAMGIEGGGVAVFAGSATRRSSIVQTNSSYAIYTTTVSGGVAKVYRDGLEAEVNASTVGTNSLGRLQVGKEQTGALYYTGQIAELFVMDGLITTSEHQVLLDWLGDRFDIPVAIQETTVFTASGDTCIMMVPTSYNGHAVVYFHGAGDTHTALYKSTGTGPLMRANVVELAKLGFAIVVANGSGDNWGNQAAIDDYVAALAYLDTQIGVDKVFHFAQSMGGLASLTAIGQGAIQCDGWYGVYPVCSLANAYAGGFNGSINIAYGIGVYATATAGYDPALRTATDYTGKRMRFVASASDTIVPKDEHTDVMIALVTGQAAEASLVTHTGTHGDPTAFQPDDVRETFTRWLV